MAEVLITLAIIGVVAAMTIPTLISSYNKKIVETRLLKFYSNMNNAIALSEIENGDKKYWAYANSSCTAESNGYDESCLTEFFNTYLKPYLKYTKTEYNYNRLYVYFLDGSAVSILYFGRDYLFYPVANKKDISGKDYFAFGLYPDMYSSQPRAKYFINKGLEPYIDSLWDGEDENLLNYESYAKVIQLNNWKIPDNYPFKF